MNEIWLQLGNQTKLCWLESAAVAHRLGYQLQLSSTPPSSGMMRVDLSAPHACTLASESSGIVRVVESWGTLKTPAAQGVYELLEETGVIDTWASLGDKVQFGVSRLPAQKPLKRTLEWQHRLGLLIKKGLQSRQASCRYIPWPKSDLTQLNAAQVIENGLLEYPPSREVVIWRAGNETLVGLTVWIQPFRQYAYRDMERPQRLRRRGILPPKLARMLINFGRTADTKMVFDPFCGSGGVLLEGVAMGLAVRGSDLAERAVQATRENLVWLSDAMAPEPTSWEVWSGDACHLMDQVAPLSIDMVVTESDLGPPLREPATASQAGQYACNLRETYLKAMGQIRSVLKPGGRLVIAVPCWRTVDEQIIHVHLKRELALMGYSEVEYPSLPKDSSRAIGQPYIYLRPGQFVGRAIWILE